MSELSAWRLYAAHAMGAILESYRNPSEAMKDGYGSELARAAMTAANAMVIEELRLAKEEKERRERGYSPLYPIAMP